MEQPKSPNKAIIGIVVVVLLAAAATAVVVLSSKSATTDEATTTTTSSSTSPSPSTSTTTTDSSSTTTYKDGTYTATGSYQTPGGTESIGVTVTLSGDMITDASVTQNASGGEAEEYQSAFAGGFKSLVVGKKIEDVSLTRVAGSSLTPNGFNNAIAAIESQAKA